MNKSIKNTLLFAKAGDQVSLNAWVRTKRGSKAITFIEVNDGSCLKNLQLIIDDKISNPNEVKEILTGTAITASGKVVESPGKGQRVEIHVNEISIEGHSTSEYPLQKKRHTNEYLRTIAHLRPRTNTFGAVFRLRNALSFAVHKFFNERDFMYVHTPIITSSDCEGAGEMFQVTTMDLDFALQSGFGGHQVDHQIKTRSS